MSDIKVYEEWDYRLVPSSHGKDIFYRIFNGTVNWDHSIEGMKPAYTILMQYGRSEEWNQAKKEIAWDMPAHVLEEDIDEVLKSVNELISSRKSQLRK